MSFLNIIIHPMNGELLPRARKANSGVKQSVHFSVCLSTNVKHSSFAFLHSIHIYPCSSSQCLLPFSHQLQSAVFHPYSFLFIFLFLGTISCVVLGTLSFRYCRFFSVDPTSSSCGYWFTHSTWSI